MIERILVAHKSTHAQRLTTITLPHPRTGKLHAFVVAPGDKFILQEIQRFKSFYSSWIVGETLVTDGGLYLATPVDPLLFLLPVLQSSRKKPENSTEEGYFCSLEQILEQAHPHFQHLSEAAADLFACVCDVKEVGGFTFFRLNDDMVLAYLLCKVAALQEALVGALGGLDHEAQLAYVIGFLSDCLEEVWCVNLSQHLKVDLAAVAGGSAMVGNTRPAPGLGRDSGISLPGASDKRPKVDPKAVAAAAAKKKAEENKQAVLAKVAQGTKSITSFFKPRTG